MSKPQKIKHFVLRELLGEGGFAAVYRGRDTRLDRDVAIKRLRPEVLLAPGAARRFRDEAKLVARLSHPNVVTLHDIITRAGESFLVMEFVPGETLEARLRRGPLPAAETARIGVQVARALAHAHNLRIVHRDLKPSNLMLTGDGSVKVMDFGLARLLPQIPLLDSGARGTGEAGLVGTPAYMSPEQVRGVPADARSDVFALGVVLFEAVVGARPFPSQTLFGLANAILHLEPQWDRVMGRTGPELRAVFARAMAKEPAERYQDMGTFARDLEMIGANAPKRAAVPLPSAIVGRSGELAALRQLLVHAAAPGGSGAAVVLSGEAGIGKSALVAELGRTATLDEGVRHIQVGFRARYDGPAMLAAALASLSGLRPVPLADVAKALHTAASLGPYLLVLEDIHRAGPDVLVALRGAVAAMPAAKGLLVMTCRTDERRVRGDEGLSGFLDWATTAGAATPLTLGRFEVADTAAILGRVLDPRRPPDDRLVAYIQAETEGNPLFITETARYLRDAGHLTESGLLEPAAGPIPLPDRVRGLLARRLVVLEPALLDVLEAAAVEGEVFHRDLVARLLGLTPEVTGAALQRLAAEYELVLAAADGNEHRFTHGKIRDVAHAQITSERRLELHGRLADVLVAAAAPAVEVARHLLDAGRREEAVPYLMVAARLASEGSAVAEARSLYGIAADSLATDHIPERDRLQILMELGRLQRVTGENAAARATLEKVALLARGDDRRCGEAIHHVGWILMAEGRLTAAVRRFERALACFTRAGDPIWVAACHDALGVAHRRAGHLPKALRAGRRSLALRRELKFTWGEALSESNLGAAFYQLGRYRHALESFERSLELLLRHGKRASGAQKQAMALDNIGVVARHLSLIDRALEASREALAIRRRLGARGGEARSLVNLAAIHDLAGMRTAARDGYERGARLAGALGDRAQRGEALCRLARLVAADGRLDDGLALAAEGLAEARAARDQEAIGIAALESAGLQLLAGDTRGAHRSIDAARAAAQKGLPAMAAPVAYVRGRLAEAEGRRADAVTSLSKALAVLRRRPEPDLAWRVHAALSRLHADAKRVDLARRHGASARRIVKRVAAGISDERLRRAYRDEPERARLFATAVAVASDETTRGTGLSQLATGPLALGGGRSRGSR